jgi:hypothetical protein
MALILPSERTANASAHPICLHPEQRSNKHYNCTFRELGSANCAELYSKATTVTTTSKVLGHEVNN